MRTRSRQYKSDRNYRPSRFKVKLIRTDGRPRVEDFSDDAYSVKSVRRQLEDEVAGHTKARAAMISVTFDRGPLADFLSPLPADPSSLRVEVRHYFEFNDADDYVIFTGIAEEFPKYINDYLYDKVDFGFKAEVATLEFGDELKDGDTSDYYQYVGLDSFITAFNQYYYGRMAAPVGA